jgi:tetratricopeptide (TPR) repeat protein
LLLRISAAALVIAAVAALAAWPSYVERRTAAAVAAGLPTMAPVGHDDESRDRLVAFWERAAGERHRGDMLSPRMLAEQYLQRYRERQDIGDVLRAERAVRQSLAAQPRGNLPAELTLASVDLTLHRFADALAMTRHAAAYDRGDPAMAVREAGLELEIGDVAGAAKHLGSVPERARDDAWRVVESRYLELTGRLAAARSLLAVAAAYQNGRFDAPVQSRAWYFFRQGEMAFEAGDNTAALAAEHQALALFPGYADALRALARFECALHRWQDCLRDASASAAIVPYPETLGYEVDAQRALGNAAAAAQTADLIRAIGTLGDRQHVTDRLLAVYYADHRLYPHEAYALAKRELHARDDILTEDTLAWTAAMDDRWSEARSHMRRALRWGTENALLDYHAAVIAAHFGDREAERAHLRRALSRNPDFHPTFADDARRRLSSS